MTRPGKPATGSPRLADLQAWFGAAIATPLPESYPGNPLELSAPELAAEAESRLRARGGLEGFARLGVYNQQYWFRLIAVMQSDYAATIHLLGLKAFNQWAVRYLQAYPPVSPFLAELDEGFPAFLAEGYHGPQRQAALQAAAYERALSRAFDAPAGRTLADAGMAPAALQSEPLRLAPHLTPLHVDWDFAEYRSRCLRDESLEQAMDPPQPASADLVIHRDPELRVAKAEVPAAAMPLLRAFPGTLADVFARLEGTLSSSDQALLERELSNWFREWSAAGWLCLDRDSEA